MKQGWEYKKLGEIASFINGDRGKNYPSAKDFVEDGIPFINAGHLCNGIINFDKMNYITYNKYSSLGSGKIQQHDILFCLRGSLGKFAIVKEESLGAIASSLVIIRPSQVVDNRFIAHFLSTPKLQEYIDRNNNGSSQPNLSAKSVASFIIPLPPKSTQLSIVSELDKINELIRLKKEQLKDYDNLAQSIFYEMFGDPVENEKGWEVKKLGEISTLICNGNTPKGGSEVYVKEGYLFLRSQNVWKNRIDLEDVAYIDESTHLSLKKSILKHNDLLITKTGRINTENSSLGRTALFEGEDGSANINGHVYLVRLKKDMVHKYILYILISNSYRELIRKTCVGGIDKRQLNKDHIEDFPIIFPPIELQKIYSNRVSIIERQKSAVQKSITDLETLLASRMQYWFE